MTTEPIALKRWKASTALSFIGSTMCTLQVRKETIEAVSFFQEIEPHSTTQSALYRFLIGSQLLPKSGGDGGFRDKSDVIEPMA